MVELPLRDGSVLDTGTSIGASSIALTSVAGWPNPTVINGTQYGIISGYDIFSYNAIDYANNVISGIPTSGTYAVGAAHIADSSVNPYYDNVEQTGWPVSKITVKRRGGVSYIQQCRLLTTFYTSAAIDNPDTPGFESDYDFISNRSNDVAQASELSWALTSGTSISLPYRWVRTICFIIDAMSDSGRGKINEIEASIVGATSDPSDPTNSLAVYSPSSMIRELLLNRLGMSRWSFTDLTVWNVTYGANSWEIGLNPYTQVLNDIGRSTACIVQYGYGGDVIFFHSPHVSGGTLSLPWFVFGENSIRGTLSRTSERAEIDGVKISGKSPTGEPWEIWYGETGASYQTLDEDGFVVDQPTGKRIAEVMFWEETNRETVTITVRGLAKWCEPCQLVSLNWDWDGNGVVTTRSFAITQVAETEELMSGTSSGPGTLSHSIQLTLAPHPGGFWEPELDTSVPESLPPNPSWTFP